MRTENRMKQKQEHETENDTQKKEQDHGTISHLNEACCTQGIGSK